MGLRDFGIGIETFSEESYIYKLIMKSTITDDVTRQFELMEEYDRTFGIYDHLQSDDLWSIMYQHPEENVVTGSRLEALVMELITLKVPEVTNEPLSNLLEYPRWILETIVAKVRNLRNREIATLDDHMKKK